MLTKKRGRKVAIHSIRIAPNYIVNYIYRLVKPFNIGLNVFCDLQYLGVVRNSGSLQAYNPRIGDYQRETFVKNLFEGIRYLLKNS